LATPENYDETSFAYRDLHGIDRWEEFTVSASLTVVGTPTYTGRYRFVGKQCFFQVSLVSDTSIASTAGTDYVVLPVTAKGVAGMAAMTDDVTNVAVGQCHIDVATSRCYVPTQGASGNTFTVAGWFEIA
jgi:hypothetical protein